MGATLARFDKIDSAPETTRGGSTTLAHLSGILVTEGTAFS